MGKFLRTVKPVCGLPDRGPLVEGNELDDWPGSLRDTGLALPAGWGIVIPAGREKANHGPHSSGRPRRENPGLTNFDRAFRKKRRARFTSALAPSRPNQDQ